MLTSVQIQLSQDKELTVSTRCEIGVWNFTFSTPSDFDQTVFEEMPLEQRVATMVALDDAVGNFSSEK